MTRTEPDELVGAVGTLHPSWYNDNAPECCRSNVQLLSRP